MKSNNELCLEGWILTYTGKKFYPLKPKAEDIDIEDIAHALSNVCCFNGHSRAFYSVAQHSILVSALVRPELQLYALLHDAAEAYLGDIVRPIKSRLKAEVTVHQGQIATLEMVSLSTVETAIMNAIEMHFDLQKPDGDAWKELKYADDMALGTEVNDLICEGLAAEWGLPSLPDYKLTLLSPREAEEDFMMRFNELNKQ